MFVVLAGKESSFSDDQRSHATLSYLITVCLAASALLMGPAWTAVLHL
jgi:hypothetical protein